MDCYYAAVEMRENPALKNIPIAVGGDTERGVLCTSNYIARQYGVRSAMSSRKAKQLCPELKIIPMQMTLYKSISNQIREIFQQYTDIIEPLSLDEAYLDVTDCSLFGGSATLIAQDILSKIFKQTGLTASAGVSINKFIAKVASDFNKPNGMCVVPPHKVIEFVQKLPVKAIPGVGKVMQQKLKSFGIENCIDLESFTITELEQKFGKMGVSLFNRVRGIDERQVCNHRESKTTSVETTFEHDIKQEQIDNELLDKLSQRLYKRLEKENKPITKLQVKLKFDDFISKTKETQHNQINLSLCQEMLIEIAKQRPANKIRLVGIGVGYGKEAIQQMQLFEQVS